MGSAIRPASDLGPADVEELERCVRDACFDTFAHYGVPLEACAGDRIEEDASASFIGFLGPRCRGVFVLVVPFALVRATCPKGPSVDRLELFDWSHELCNAVFGRFKNKLVARCIEIDQSLPKLLLDRASILGAAEVATCSLAASSEHGAVRAFVDAFPLRGEARLFDGAPAEPAAAEGEVLLF